MVMSCATRLLPAGARGNRSRTSTKTGVARCRAWSMSLIPPSGSSPAFNSATRATHAAARRMWPTWVAFAMGWRKAADAASPAARAARHAVSVAASFAARCASSEGGDALQLGSSRAVYELPCGINGCPRSRITGVGVLEYREDFLSALRHVARYNSQLTHGQLEVITRSNRSCFSQDWLMRGSRGSGQPVGPCRGLRSRSQCHCFFPLTDCEFSL